MASTAERAREAAKKIEDMLLLDNLSNETRQRLKAIRALLPRSPAATPRKPHHETTER